MTSTLTPGPGGPPPRGHAAQAPAHRTLRYGTTAQGDPAAFDTAAEIPHILISGNAGSGVTTTARIIVLAAACQGFRVRFASPAPAAGDGLHGLPRIQAITTPQDVIWLIDQTYDEMLTRLAAIEELRHGPDYPPVLLAIDGFEHPALQRRAATIKCIAACGRAARIHVLLAGHAPLPGMNILFGTRLLLGRPGPHQARVMFSGDPAAGREIPRGLPGAGTATTGGTPFRVQVHWPGPVPALAPAAADPRPGARWIRAAARRPRRGQATQAPSLVQAAAAEAATRFLYLVHTALWTCRAQLANDRGTTGTCPDNPGPPRPGPCIGAVDHDDTGDRVLLRPLAAYQAAADLAARLDVPFQLTFPQLCAVMRDSGLLEYSDPDARPELPGQRPAAEDPRLWNLAAADVVAASYPCGQAHP
jgi:hypothetical protein